MASATKKAESKENIVEFNKAKYKVTAKKFHYNGTIHDADDLAENKELVKELVEIGAGFLVKIEE